MKEDRTWLARKGGINMATNGLLPGYMSGSSFHMATRHVKWKLRYCTIDLNGRRSGCQPNEDREMETISAKMAMMRLPTRQIVPPSSPPVSTPKRIRLTASPPRFRGKSEISDSRQDWTSSSPPRKRHKSEIPNSQEDSSDLSGWDDFRESAEREEAPEPSNDVIPPVEHSPKTPKGTCQYQHNQHEGPGQALDNVEEGRDDEGYFPGDDEMTGGEDEVDGEDLKSEDDVLALNVKPCSDR
ncbi:hypothetical protein B0T21DRAFT_345760 [Apiosordaria backusii]|uniref:Uncharacterized protein n=1 Tax=Apiosordaria backusii TaxID=314023 RepID=A0AA40EM62_9PEZI|nr:hypothetical protein B0T21DRAFT_345760 [Apiosordaria backusii]